MAEELKQDERSEIYSRECGIPGGSSVRIRYGIAPAGKDGSDDASFHYCLSAEVRSPDGTSWKPWLKRIPFRWLRLEQFLALCRRILREAAGLLLKLRRMAHSCRGGDARESSNAKIK